MSDKASVVYRAQRASVTVKAPTASASSGVQIAKVFVERPVYDGPLTVTPSDETQVLQTAGLTVLQNITVEPVPSNYGRITWNGSFLTVS